MDKERRSFETSLAVSVSALRCWVNAWYASVLCDQVDLYQPDLPNFLSKSIRQGRQCIPYCTACGSIHRGNPFKSWSKYSIQPIALVATVRRRFLFSWSCSSVTPKMYVHPSLVPVNGDRISFPFSHGPALQTPCRDIKFIFFVRTAVLQNIPRHPGWPPSVHPV